MDNQQIIQLISTCPALTEAFHKQVLIHCTTVTNPPVILREKQLFSSGGEGKLSFNLQREKLKLKRFCTTSSHAETLLLPTDHGLSQSLKSIFFFHFPWLTAHPQMGFGHQFYFSHSCVIECILPNTQPHWQWLLRVPAMVCHCLVKYLSLPFQKQEAVPAVMEGLEKQPQNQPKPSRNPCHRKLPQGMTAEITSVRLWVQLCNTAR